MIQQRTGRDCGVAALAIYVAYRAAQKAAPGMHGLAGAFNRDVVAFAKHIEPITLRQRRRFDLDRDEGILRVYWTSGERKKKNPGGHFVAVIRGTIHDPGDATVLPWRDYCARFDAKPATLLKVAS